VEPEICGEREWLIDLQRILSGSGRDWLRPAVDDVGGFVFTCYIRGEAKGLIGFGLKEKGKGWYGFCLVSSNVFI